MAIGFRQVSTATLNTAGTGPLTLNVPAGVQNNDGMIVAVLLNTQVTITAPTGWTQLGSNGDDGTLVRTALYYRVASGEPASYDWNFGAATKAVLICSAYSGTDATTPFYGAVWQAEAGTATAHASSTCTLVGGGNDWLLSIGTDRGGTAATWTDSDASDAERADVANTGSSQESGVLNDSNRTLAAGNYTLTLTSTFSGSNAGVWLAGIASATAASVPAQFQPPAGYTSVIAVAGRVTLGDRTLPTNGTAAPADYAIWSMDGQNPSTAATAVPAEAAWTLTGQDAVTATGATPAEAALSFTGQDTTVTATVAAADADFSLAGQDGTAAVAVTPAEATFTLAGQDATVSTVPATNAPAGTATWTLDGQDATPSITANPAEAPFSFAGQDATVTTSGSTVANAGVATWSLDGQDASTAVTAGAAAASWTLDGQQATPAAGATPAAASFTATANDLTAIATVNADAALWSLLGLDAAVPLPFTVGTLTTGDQGIGVATASADAVTVAVTTDKPSTTQSTNTQRTGGPD